MADDDAPDPARLLKLARQAMTSAEYRRKFHVADFWGQAEWYEPQLRFFAAGIQHHQRLIRGGNQTGKSWCCAYEAALHMTGQYPKWWNGRRFNKPTRGWVIGPERTLVRDGPQKNLCAMQGEFGTGAIPLATLRRQTGDGSGRNGLDRYDQRGARDGRRPQRHIDGDLQIVRAGRRKNAGGSRSIGFGLTNAAQKKSTAS
jgi:hypothetical protein